MSKSKNALDTLIEQEYSSKAAARTPRTVIHRQPPKQRVINVGRNSPAPTAPPKPIHSRQELYDTLGPLAEELGLRVSSIKGGKEKCRAKSD